MSEDFIKVGQPWQMAGHAGAAVTPHPAPTIHARVCTCNDYEKAVTDYCPVHNHIRVQRGQVWICSSCGVRWPCLAAHLAVAKR